MHSLDWAVHATVARRLRPQQFLTIVKEVPPPPDQLAVGMGQLDASHTKRVIVVKLFTAPATHCPDHLFPDHAGRPDCAVIHQQQSDHEESQN